VVAKTPIVKRKRQVDRIVDYRAVFNTEDGKRVLYDLIKQHNVLQSTFSKDPYEHAFKEGERNTVLRILTLLKIDPIQLDKLIDQGRQIEESYY
jgi:hypothetical protein